jgi:spermidine synthase
MSALFEELDYRVTPMGAISLRRRRVLSLDRDVYEVMLGDEHLMSSLFTEGEIALATLGLAAVEGSDLAVVVGGLGLGYTARAALDDPRTGEVMVIDAMAAVIEWQRLGLTPMGDRLAADPRCRLVEGDFFALAETGLDPADRDRRWDAVLLDIDHSPRALLNPAHARFYTRQGLAALAGQLRPGGVFALWSDAPPDSAFEAVLAEAFTDASAQVVSFATPVTGGESRCTIYVSRAR